MSWVRHLLDLLRFMQEPRLHRRLVFYCENGNYWPHLEGLVRETLESIDHPICYISSEADDPGLRLEHPHLSKFEIGAGFVRDWLFANIDADVMVMTMPDLDQHQVKRSRHPVHYVYVQHSLISLHMAYQRGAFDHYDTVFCAGPHHIAEVRALEAAYDLPAKKVVEHGYARLDEILLEAADRAPDARTQGAPTHVLVAPSWGPNGIIETIGDRVVDQLLEHGFRVTLRPHPQTAKFAADKLAAIVKKHGQNDLFAYEQGVAGQESLHRSDVMISDWSGAALDYAFGLGKPVLFIDVPRKVNNPDYQQLKLIPFEESIREQIGRVMSPDDLEQLASEVEASVAMGGGLAELRQRNVYHVGESDRAGARAIAELLAQQTGAAA